MSDTPKWKAPSFIEGHLKLYLENPEAAHMWDSRVVGGPGPLPTLLLTTRGKRTGAPRHAPLLYGKVPTGYAVIASKGGFVNDPSWYVNLQANPECEVRVGKDKFRARARRAEGKERADIWAQMTKDYPPYNDYQARTKREIPIVVLEPIR